MTTGRPEYDRSGNLQDFCVERGRVSVEGDGLNGHEADRVSIYTRAAEINADVWANHLNITTGANVINSKTGQASAIAVKNDSDKPQVALDISAVGGMYAGVIELVGTEKGLGVNQAGQIGAMKALSLEADGTLHVAGNIYSAGSMNVSTGAINNYEGAN